MAYWQKDKPTWRNIGPTAELVRLFPLVYIVKLKVCVCVCVCIGSTKNRTSYSVWNFATFKISSNNVVEPVR